MKLRFPVVFAVAILAAPAMTAALAQGPRDMLSPPSDLTRPEHGEPAYSLDTLFGALKIAPDAASAKAIENRIWEAWIESGSDTCDLLMTRVKDAIEEKDYDLAIRLLNSIIAIRPGYVEAWNQRATVYYLKNDYPRAIADIAQVLAREPRQFGALAGLGMMLQDIGDDKDALDAYRKALAIDPHLENIPDAIKTLSEKVEGRDI
ncbi:MAG TPA: tetratricopeptide repeat protein [Xanthobacteraceae bacterium]|jgi:tetratricopeptide (TPR) repeat protein|nr:tetratricopeptide repeat protein [Xanthobacteraceae bacterium]